MPVDLPGTLRRHPEWPEVKELAMRTNFVDGQNPGWTSWVKSTPDGTTFVTADAVENWPAVTLTDET